MREICWDWVDPCSHFSAFNNQLYFDLLIRCYTFWVLFINDLVIVVIELLEAEFG